MATRVDIQLYWQVTYILIMELGTVEEGIKEGKRMNQYCLRAIDNSSYLIFCIYDELTALKPLRLDYIILR